jgi:uncharacterized phage-associated protein
MATAHDVAAYILRQRGAMSTWKLQKLVYYSQAWHLVWDEEPLFENRIEAWANGPVVKDLYRVHRGRFTIDSWPDGDPGALTKSERETIDVVLAGYGGLTGRALSHLTHAEDPWLEARGDLGPTDRSTATISPESMFEFYTALDADSNAQPVEEIDWDELDEAERLSSRE